MPVDYDLVIVGGSLVGRYAAARASRWGARVALVEPPIPHPTASLSGHLLTRLSRAIRQQHWLSQAAFDHPSTADCSWQAVTAWSQAVIDVVHDVSTSETALPTLAALGVDVILEQGEFYRRPTLGIAVAGRSIRATAYLLATATDPILPTIDGLSAIPYLTLDRLSEPSWSHLPQNWLILGRDPRGIELAQALNRLGASVTLVTAAPRLLPQEDAEAAALIQACLEAEGVTVLTQTQVTQAKQFDRQIWLQVGNQAIATDVLLLATRRVPRLAGLNLEAAGVQCGPSGIRVNPKLQTSHPQIYACGEALGGYPGFHLARAEADVAIQNALFLPIHRMNYQPIPWALFTDPEWVRVGLTETQAHQLYGDEVRVQRQSLQTLVKAQAGADTTGFCKLITHRTGELLGAHLVAADASECSGPLVLAIQQRLKLKHLARLPLVSPTLAEVLRQAAQTATVAQRPTWQQELLATWFGMRRSS
ncbi:MAG: NAD(P)/FAD-dependent oxidoreductase [Synechococcales cyanobacterium M58_A2018_015]|nr:NAD(P)/FAD-dependent oxidoreductase [Synechococcales cyanobacterium M58_A2018_015]